MSTIEKAMGKRKELPENVKISQSIDELISAKTVDANKIAEKAESAIATNSKQVDKKRAIRIDSARLKGLGIINDGNDLDERLIKDEFRAIKRKIINGAFGNKSEFLTNSNLVMVSSARMNEGKTFVAINLALSIASEKDKTVLLVDADVLSPSVADTLGIDNNKPGLIDYLLGDIDDVSDIIYSTSISDLRIMPAGVSHHLSYELLSSDRMQALTQELANRYPDRIIVLDCPLY
ncbi:AAA family ATPase [Vibrio algarum]|uniref:AAA family ATPase n=1 Tax=Vibrio algarum TaxID=3020714 RepID=A0ABT4YQH4_9VIBR|nr:AAA family ATPase [Vibrio sp. KJ40-1]MDB1123730.1 AAA family ATPase [Vibrio sp. KJ40-1]